MRGVFSQKNPMTDFFEQLTNPKNKLTFTIKSDLSEVKKIDGREDFIKSLSDINPQMTSLLRAILSEWSRTDGKSYADRINSIRNGGGNNGTYVLGAAQMFTDAASDRLTGGSGFDWFFRFNNGSATSDVITDLASGEVITELL